MAKDTMALLENMFRKHVMELGTERWNWGKKGRDWLEVRESSCGQAGAGTWVSLTLTMHLHLYYMVPLAWEAISCSLQR